MPKGDKTKNRSLWKEFKANNKDTWWAKMFNDTWLETGIDKADGIKQGADELIGDTGSKIAMAGGAVGGFLLLKKFFKDIFSFKNLIIVAGLVTGAYFIHKAYKGMSKKAFDKVKDKGADVALNPKKDGLSGKVNENLTTAEKRPNGKEMTIKFADTKQIAQARLNGGKLDERIDANIKVEAEELHLDEVT